MRFRQIAAAVLGAAVLFTVTSASGGELEHVVQMIPNLVDMETEQREKEAQEETQEEVQEEAQTEPAEAAQEGPGNLYALSAVLMDADSGRVLYAREGETARPNASTTKVMTCILALENASGDDYVMVSANAAAQPEVKLGVREGEQYYLEDLLYSLMLKSHNDVAVAIAEHIAGSVEAFAGMMNEKARELGCTDTYFVTPNGLDAADGGGTHHTTARDLALIMRYAIRNETFLRITQTRDHAFTDLGKSRQFSVHNANALLDMMDGVISGKTGFTGNAGYCYVCAWGSGDRTFIVSLLGCGWPGNKSYKWSDTRALLKYGEENYEYRGFWKEPSCGPVLVTDGVSGEDAGKDADADGVYLNGQLQVTEEEKERKILCGRGEEVICRVSLPEKVAAPVEKGQVIGRITYSLNGMEVAEYPILAEKAVEKISYLWCVDNVFHRFFHS